MTITLTLKNEQNAKAMGWMTYERLYRQTHASEEEREEYEREREECKSLAQCEAEAIGETWW